MAKVKDGARSTFSGKADGLVYVQFNGGIYTCKVPKRKMDSSTLGLGYYLTFALQGGKQFLRPG